MSSENYRAMEERHLTTFRQVRERLLAQRVFWERAEHPRDLAANRIALLDDAIAINASLIAIAEHNIA